MWVNVSYIEDGFVRNVDSITLIYVLPVYVSQTCIRVDNYSCKTSYGLSVALSKRFVRFSLNE